MKKIMSIIMVCQFLCSAVLASSSQFDEMFDPVEDNYLKGNKLVEHEYGFEIEGPSSEWEWYKSKKPISERDYLLAYNRNNLSYIIQFNKNWKPITEKSVNEFIRGIKKESTKQGYTVNIISSELMGKHDERSILLSYEILSVDNDIKYHMNAYVMVANRTYVSIQQYQSDDFGLGELKQLLKGIKILESPQNVINNNGDYYYNLGQTIGELIMPVLVLGIFVFLISLLVKSFR
jgi:hypothetical protein